ncbi:restriction endonuclease subunit S [Enterococcus hirae]|uniref:restriction endonuclease subunit S n=1 Tax=Enterococcus hirae TaxID=1354 RepID=UPI0025438B40|nr:restriction endonuclease subunit S [Enterococcus hirae]MDK4469133.1 restriction endonuclease subunit S [Enterococcus hirae]
MSNDTLPEIRFPEFTDEWEQRELSDISTKVQTKNKDREFTETLTNSAEFGIISQNDFFDKEISNKNNIDGYYVVKPNDFVYNPRISNFAPVGPIKRNKLGRTGVMSPLYYVFSTNNIDNQYLETYFSTSYWHKFMKLNGDSGARADRFAIRDSVFVKMPIPYPSREEQEKIGQFFEVLSNAIDLQQRNLDLLKETKKGFLQKMFPKNGAKVPEIRFPGFTEDWEQRKLSEMAGFSKGNGYSKADLVEKGHPVILYGRLYTKYETVIEKVDTFAELKEKSVISNGGEVIVPASGETPEDISRASVVDVSGVALGGDLNIIKTKSELDPTFLALTISNGSQQKEMTKRAQGKSVVHLHNSDLKEVNLLYPKLDEQVKIGSFFKKLDVAITLHQRKLDLLKETKKGFLQKMFV